MFLLETVTSKFQAVSSKLLLYRFLHLEVACYWLVQKACIILFIINSVVPDVMQFNQHLESSVLERQWTTVWTSESNLMNVQLLVPVFSVFPVLYSMSAQPEYKRSHLVNCALCILPWLIKQPLKLCLQGDCSSFLLKDHCAFFFLSCDCVEAHISCI